VVLADYRAQASVREWVLAFKHGARPDLARVLGRALAARLERRVPDFAAEAPLVVPVPLHRIRRWERGYDQARLLAERVGGDLGLAVAPLLRRVRPTEVQGSLGAPSRRANVAGAFSVRPPRRWWTRGLSGRSVWLVDDVATSGATASECARVLRRLGAARVGLLALARAEGPSSTEDASEGAGEGEGDGESEGGSEGVGSGFEPFPVRSPA
jgi:ComF family protein